MAERRPRWWLTVLSRLVPASSRAEWLREWRAELARLERDTSARNTSRRGRVGATLLCLFSALEDAVGIWGRSAGRSAGMNDVRLACRSLLRSPTFTLVSLITLALAIGANAAIYSVVYNVLFRALPYSDSAALVDVRLSFRHGETGADHLIPASEPEFLELADADVGLRVAGYWTGDVNLGGGAEPVRVPAAYVSADLFDLLGVEPIRGRTFVSGEDRPGRDGVVVLTHGLWVRAFGADQAVLGRTITLNGSPATVVGVLPEEFVFPGGGADVFRPNVIDPTSLGGRSSHYLSMLGRLGDGRDLAGAQARVDDFERRWSEANPGLHGISPNHPITLLPLRETMVGEMRSSLLLLLGIVGLILLIASANVGSLVLVRIEHRQAETGVRVALGAGRRGVVTPFLAETAIIAVFGAVFGLLLAAWSVRGVELWGPAQLTRLGHIGINGAVLAFTVLVTTGSAVLFGLVPALSATRGNLSGRLRGGGRGTIVGRPRTVLRQGLVVGQVTLAVVVVIGAGLLIKSFARLRAIDPGLDPSGVVTMDLSLGSAEYPSVNEIAAFHEALDESMRGLPGIVAAGAIRSLPFARSPGVESMKPVDRPTADDEYWNAQYQVVSPGVFKALAIPLLSGRAFRLSDRAGSQPVAIVNQAMAETFWKDAAPIGTLVKFGPPDGDQPVLRIVGVVGNVRQSGYRDDVAPQIFVPRAQAGAIYDGLATRFATLVIRSELPPAAVMSAAKRVIHELAPELPVSKARTMPAVMAGSVTDERFLAGLLGVFSFLALTLGAIGLGGLVAYTVERRTPELGLRIALGAEPRSILARILSNALGLAAAGAVLGIAISLLGAGIVEAHLFEVSATDPAVFIVSTLALLSAALVAAWLPAWRAARTPPTEAMRES